MPGPITPLLVALTVPAIKVGGSGGVGRMLRQVPDHFTYTIPVAVTVQREPSGVTLVLASRSATVAYWVTAWSRKVFPQTLLIVVWVITSSRRAISYSFYTP